MASVFLAGNISIAQDAEFDLSSQRSESQTVKKVPGEKLDHQGIVINPMPQEMTISRTSSIDITKGVRIKSRRRSLASLFRKEDPQTTDLSIQFGETAARKNGVKEISGAYSLTVDKHGISITGYDERGAFYGTQTLQQLIESPIAKYGILPYMKINDYPDLPVRGVVEGFYGTPWSHKVRLSLIDFYGKFKLNTYLYGPKDDPYHSCPDWRLPYPEQEAENIRELVRACNRNYVDFVWAIHPGQDIRWNEEDYMNLLNKFNLMYDLGVRSFAIFFDDISGEGTDPEKQTALLNRLQNDFVTEKGDVSSLTVCPTDYSKLWANPTPEGSLSIYGRSLDPSVKVFWTGDVVCSDLTEETLEWVNSRIRRPAFYWWNYPVTDYARHIIMQGPVYGLETSLTSDDLCGFVSNPMEHGEASKLALYSVADYTWNIEAYNPADSWERGIERLVPEASDAYRTFAIHSCDTESGYRRDESWETVTFRVDDYTQSQFNALMKECIRIENVPSELEYGCDNSILLEELRPWLAEFGKLGTRCRKALELIDMYKNGDDGNFWSRYVDNLMSEKDVKDFEAHKSGTMKLQPFYEYAMDDMGSGFFEKISGERPASYKGISSFGNSGTLLCKLMTDNNPDTHYTSGDSQKEGDWIGVDLCYVRDVNEIVIAQGRNSVDDCDFFDNAVLEASADGKNRTALTGDLHNTYDISWKGATKARYLRLRRLESERHNWATVRMFNVNPTTVGSLGFNVRAEDTGGAMKAFDKKPETSYINKGILAFDIPENTDGYILLLKLDEDSRGAVLRQKSADGSTISEIALSAPFIRTELEKGAESIEIEGDIEIFEIIAQ